MTKFFTLTTFLLLLPILPFAQNLVIKSCVLDAETNTPLEYAVIEIKALKKGVYTDKKGHFTIDIPGDAIKQPVEISCLGYEKKILSASDLSQMSTVLLVPQPILLPELAVVPTKSVTRKFGIVSDKPWTHYQIGAILGSQTAQYIANKFDQEGILKNVSFYVLNVGCPDAPFRVRIFQYDPIKKEPGEDLLMESVIVNAPKRAGWFTVDLSKFRVRFPKEGIVVSVERISAGEQYYYVYERPDFHDPKKINTFRLYGVAIGEVYKQKEPGLWENRGLGDVWMPINQYYKGYINLMVNADVIFADKK